MIFNGFFSSTVCLPDESLDGPQEGVLDDDTIVDGPLDDDPLVDGPLDDDPLEAPFDLSSSSSFE